MTPPVRCVELIQWFNDIRSSAGDVDKPIKMDDIEDWQRHRSITLHRWERDCIFAMDRSLRNSYANIVKWHSERKPIKLDSGNDWNKAQG